MKYARIIIDISHENVDRIFEYRIPEELEPQIRVGTQLRVPFGKANRMRTGYVVDITDTTEYDASKIKEAAGIVAGSVSAQSQLIQLAWWMKERYGSTMNQALKSVLPVKKQVKARKKEVVRRVIGELGTEYTQTTAPALNEEQRAAAEDFCRNYDAGKRRPVLLHGITGSGKTEVYMAMIDHVRAQGKQVILLIPEIALTYQTVMRFYHRYGDKVSILHSRLSAGEKYDQLERASRGETDIMIGPRSALFTPFSQLGLIVMDEEHEGAYKSETSPRYLTSEVVIKLASMCGAGVVFGSATPSLETYTKAVSGEYTLYELHKRAKEDSRPSAVNVVDLRKELAEGNKTIFSRRLQILMEDRLRKGEQILLFLNRRGFANFVSCRSCGEAIRCPHCDVSLTLHGGNRLVCHYCGYEIPLPERCPVCSSPYIAHFGIGTQRVESMTRKMFPAARILRMDMDTTSKKGGHEAILSAFANHEADILIGTQMIVKGHDFPNVTLVGALAADTSLYAADYRCAERTFQLLAQAAGRAGRDSRPGEAVIQTYIPEHYSIQAAAKQDYKQFYEQEMAYRRMMGYPPACHMLAIMAACGDEASLEAFMDQAAACIGTLGTENRLVVIGPVNAPVYKVNDIYRKILYLKHGQYDILIRIRKTIEQLAESLETAGDISIQYDFS